MGHPVTTNPFIIMLINMTVVFIVLVSLSFLIRAIHALDPTVKKAEPEPAPVQARPAPAPAPVPVPEPQGVPGEVLAAIAAALASFGVSAGQIRAVRPIDRVGWRESGRIRA